jgi:hypothetical protein
MTPRPAIRRPRPGTRRSPAPGRRGRPPAGGRAGGPAREGRPPPRGRRPRSSSPPAPPARPAGTAGAGGRGPRSSPSPRCWRPPWGASSGTADSGRSAPAGPRRGAWSGRMWGSGIAPPWPSRLSHASCLRSIVVAGQLRPSWRIDDPGGSSRRNARAPSGTVTMRDSMRAFTITQASLIRIRTV